MGIWSREHWCFFLSIGFILTIVAIRASSGVRVVRVCTGGLFNTRARREDAVRWDDITAARMQLTAPRYGSMWVSFTVIAVSGKTVEPTLTCTLKLRSGRRVKYKCDYEEALQLTQHIHDHLAERKFNSRYKDEWDPRQINIYWEYSPGEMTTQEGRAPSPAELIEQLSKQQKSHE